MSIRSEVPLFQNSTTKRNSEIQNSSTKSSLRVDSDCICCGALPRLKVLDAPHFFLAKHLYAQKHIKKHIKTGWKHGGSMVEAGWKQGGSMRKRWKHGAHRVGFYYFALPPVSSIIILNNVTRDMGSENSARKLSRRVLEFYVGGLSRTFRSEIPLFQNSTTKRNSEIQNSSTKSSLRVDSDCIFCGALPRLKILDAPNVFLAKQSREKRSRKQVIAIIFFVIESFLPTRVSHI